MQLKKTFLIILIIQLPAALLSQHSGPGNWLMYFGMNRFSDKLSLHTEIQHRNHTLMPVNIEQLLLRTGLNYHISPDVFVTAGYGFIGSHSFESDLDFPETAEHRIWQQLIMNNYLGRLKFEHRYRLEQRWIEADYRNRLRYRIMMFIPLNKPKIEENTWFIGLYDEIFLNTQKVFFDRNRLYGALGYQVNKPIQVQAGLLHQQLNDFGKWYLQFALVFNPDFRK